MGSINGAEWMDVRPIPLEKVAHPRELGIDLNGDNEKCLVIDEINWETRFYDYDSAADSWIHIKTLPGIGYPEDWSICTANEAPCEEEGCLKHYIRPAP